MNTRVFSASVILAMAGLISSLLCNAQNYSSAQLLKEGTEAYKKGKCVQAAEFLFAYRLGNPPAMKQPAHRDAVNESIEWCEENTALSAGGKSDEFDGPPATPPPKNLTPPSTPDSSVTVPPPGSVGMSLPNARCDVYANTAVFQYRLHQQHKCGAPDSRWNPNVKYHYEWCTHVSGDQPRTETRARQDALEACAASPK